MTTDFPSTFQEHWMIKMVGYDMAKTAAKKLYEQTSTGPEVVEAVELHDCFTANELLTYEAIGMCKEGEAEKFIEDGQNIRRQFVTNPSGGLLSKGHPLGATRLAQYRACGTCAAPPSSVRSQTGRSRSSTTCGSAARA